MSDKSSSQRPLPAKEELNKLREKIATINREIEQLKRQGEPTATRLSRHLPAIQQTIRQVERQLRSRVQEKDELEAIYAICQAITSSLDLTEVLNEVMDEIIRLTGAERASLMLVEPESGELQFRAARNIDRETIVSSSFEISRSIVNQVAESGDPILTTNAQADPRFKKRQSVIGYNLRSILCVPLRVGGDVTGVIYADNRILTGLFTDHDLDMLTAFSGQAAVAIENARLFENVVNAKTLMDNVFASIAGGVITTDQNDRITLFNQAAEEILEIKEERVIGARLESVFPTLIREIRPVLTRVKDTGNPVVGFELETTVPDRGSVYLRTSLSPLKDRNGAGQGIAIVIDDLTEQRRLEARYQLFQRYLSPTVIERLPNDPDELRLGGQRQEITSLFADIRGFTDFTQLVEPDILVDILNQYLAIGAEAVLVEEGTLDKFMGDAVMAFFNAPLPQKDHVMRAVRSGLWIQQEVEKLHAHISAPHQLTYGVGIAVGEAVVGNVGTSKRLDYTAIGSSVNLAARLQDEAAPGQILISPSTYERVADQVDARPLSPIRVKGFSQPIRIYELLGLR